MEGISVHRLGLRHDPCAVFAACFLEPRLSDHKCLWLTGSFAFERVGHFVFSPTCQLVRPEGVTLAAWREAVASFFEGVQVEWEHDVDVQWAQLAALVELSLKRALASLHGQTENALHGFDGHGLRPKGSLAAVVQALRPSCGQAPAVTEGARLQRLASFLGRLHEAVRVQSRPVGETRALLDKIAATWPSELAVSSVEEAIPACEALIQGLRQQRRDHSLSSWRSKMAQGGRDTTRWLKNKAGLLVPALSWTVKPPRPLPLQAPWSCSSPFGGRSGIGPSPRIRMPSLLNCEMAIRRRKLPGQEIRAHFVMWSLKRARANSQSSAGPDGVTPQNLADMPRQFWTLFAGRLVHWSERNVFPEAWREARMVLLSKDDLAGAVAALMFRV